MSALRKFVNFIKKPTFIAFAVVTVLSLMIWFLLPRIEINGTPILSAEWIRLSIILLIVFIWGIGNLILQKRQDDDEKSNSAKQKELVAKGVAPDPKILAAYLDTLRTRFKNAFEVANKSTRKRGFFQGINYRLPWYILVGDEDSGKTTLLNNSGLEFYEEYNADVNVIKDQVDPGVSWCFSTDAVFVDVKGKIFTNSQPKSLETSIWTELLELLNKHRRKKPISGVILTVNIDRLLHASPDERQKIAFKFRQRLQEINDKFGVDCPVYCTFTKCDLIAGFTEYFDSLNDHDRNQMWGITIPQHEKNVVSYVIEGFTNLVTTTRSRLLPNLQLNEWDTHRSGLINGFLLQLASMGEVIKEFIIDIYQRNGYYDASFLRGIYFVSSCQQGSPIDYVAAATHKDLGLDYQPLPEQINKDQSYFVKYLLGTFIESEKNIIPLSHYRRQNLYISRACVYTCAIAIVATGLGLWWDSHNKNSEMLTKADVLLNNLKMRSINPKYQGSLSKHIPILDGLNQMVFDLTPDNKTLSYHWGLFVGGIPLKPLNKVYLRELQDYFLPYLKDTLAASITTEQKSKKNEYSIFNNLQAYLMLSTPSKIDKSFVERWMRDYWREVYPTSQLYRVSLRSNLQSLLHLNKSSTPTDQTLVKGAREYLKKLTVSELAYYNLLRNTDHTINEDIRMQMSLNANFHQLFGNSANHFNILDMFTAEGYTNLFEQGLKPAIDNLSEAWWVLGIRSPEIMTETQKQQVVQGVTTLYMNDYISHWMKALSSLKVAKFNNINDANNILLSLTSDESPILKILTIVWDNTGIKPYTGLEYVHLTNSSKKKNSHTKVEESFALINGIIGAKSQTGSEGAESGGSGKSKSPYDSLVMSFNKLLKDIHSISVSSDPDEAAYQFILQSLSSSSGASKTSSSDVSGKQNDIQNLLNISQSLPAPINEWVATIADNTWGAILNNASVYVNNEWQEKIYPKYLATIANKYPFNPKAKNEVQLSDFKLFFGKDGVLDTFIAKKASQFIDTDSAKWKWKTINHHSVSLSDKALQQIQQADKIKQALFSSTGELGINFMVGPSNLDGASQAMIINLNGQTIKYQHGPQQFLAIKWPNTVTYPMSQLSFVGLNGETITKTEAGDWGWFKLLNDLQITQDSSPSRIIVNAASNGHYGSFVVQTKSWVNPFYPNMFKNFELPKSLK